ncbi:MAG TPA: glycosyltransferase family 4 protein [Mucilaginibacter sp.]|jgi:UDP-N-acetylmuramyl pentapeptide phosphotransferase/UDP-N-acetylglucosamine-1-phosphate transferase|nr:glycosyltransferase family 4 protein [Mucilaginibacter sp.]
MHLLLLFTSFCLLFVLELIYLKIADKYNIIDHPNERSSHSNITIRGGGIIFLFAALIALIWHFNDFYTALFGVILIGVISFLDDVYSLSNQLRIFFHFASVSLVFIYLGIFGLLPWWETLLLYILSIGIINAYNFMDGINGMTGWYSVVILASLQWVNLYQFYFIKPDLIWLPLLACTVFLFFNFRKKARCFAGDVGSVTIALWIIMLLFDLIFTSNNWVYILFLGVYGVDTVLTILHRLLLKQNIFKAHRLHFYQLLANEQKISHLLISACYALVQLVIILFVINNSSLSGMALFLMIILPLIFTYLILKPLLHINRKADL